MLSILLVSLSLTLGTVGYCMKCNADELAYLTSVKAYEIGRDFEDSTDPCSLTQSELDVQYSSAGAYEVQLEEICN